MEILARARLKFQVLSEGRPDGGSDQELAMIVAQIRRLLSVTAIKAQVGCLLGRLHQVGPGNKQLDKKREDDKNWLNYQYSFFESEFAFVVP